MTRLAHQELSVGSEEGRHARGWSFEDVTCDYTSVRADGLLASDGGGCWEESRVLRGDTCVLPPYVTIDAIDYVHSSPVVCFGQLDHGLYILHQLCLRCFRPVDHGLYILRCCVRRGPYTSHLILRLLTFCDDEQLHRQWHRHRHSYRHWYGYQYGYRYRYLSIVSHIGLKAGTKALHPSLPARTIYALRSAQGPHREQGLHCLSLSSLQPARNADKSPPVT